MKALIKILFNYLGFTISRNIPLRNSMFKSIEWLRESHFLVNTVLDVGASDGRWSKDCIKYFPDATYVLYEPQPCHSDALDSFVKENSDKMKVIKKAVGLTSGITYFDKSDPFGGSLADSKSDRTIEVNVTSIDESINETWMKGPFLLKLDTHGFEIPILEGAKETLSQCEILIIEAYNYNITSDSLLFWQLCEYLHKKGFRPIDLIDVSYRVFDNSLWQMDIVFVKSTWTGFKYISYK